MYNPEKVEKLISIRNAAFKDFIARRQKEAKSSSKIKKQSM